MTKPRPRSVTFGANLRRARLDADLTQEQLAERMGMKRTTPISLWERALSLPEPRTIVRLAAAVGRTPADLLRDVITPLDALRGYAVTPPLELARELATREIIEAASVKLTPEQLEWLDLGARAGHTLQRTIAAMLVEVLHERASGRIGASDARFRSKRSRSHHGGETASGPSTRGAR
jgi:transcriptional regulator with XRE-family HTH domain